METTLGDPLAPFSEPVRKWFSASFEGATPAQASGWESIASGADTLICAPTGSGKTLASFLWGIDRLSRLHADIGAGRVPEPEPGVRLVYVSPLKALSYDIERNLRAPLRGIGLDISVGLRTGDTPQNERNRMRREPPEILITTPESLYLMLSSGAREILTRVETVIVDEIHAVAATKRGAHLALTLERLEHLVRENADEQLAIDGQPDSAVVQRIGLSATQRPLERIATFLSGPGRECRVVDPGQRKELDLEIVVPVEDMTAPEAEVHEVGSADDGSADDAPIRSIWPAIYPELLAQVRAHTSTIVFVNNRRAAERLAQRLNDLDEETGEVESPNRTATEEVPIQPAESAGLPLARAHHGSLSHEERTEVEEQLKSGLIPCLVATSSLELGIDMGAVDLVVQVESPKSVARGLQRIGRAGHGLGETSKGRIFPKFRGDLLESAVVTRRMREGQIEETVIPSNPLDVLAQHLVSMASLDKWGTDEAFELIRRTTPFAELSIEQFENVLDMLDGRYPSDRFAELRPRLVWDRTGKTIEGRKGARSLVVTNAGTIPDRGLYGVHLPDGRRVGELDEEMVYEARAGQVFLLGASSWRIQEITRDRVIVVPAPGVPGAIPFWKGDGIGRPAELGEAIGAFAREAVNADPAELEKSHDLDPRAARNLIAYLKDQQDATRVVPSDTTVVIERFRDEIGDWRLVVLSPWGGRVHAAWGLAIARKLRDEHGLEADAIHSDDGIAVHLPDADEPPSADLVLVEPDELEDLVVRELGTSALFGARFRENAARSLLIPRAYPGKRTPLWQQRLKAQSLLEVAQDFPRFPVILETYRECLQDVFDLPALDRLLRGIHSREISLVEVETQTASPFASSLLFDYVATYMYEGDTPNAERRATALSLDRELLRELLGQDELRELIDEDALAEVEASLQHLTEQGQASDRDGLQQILRRIGDLTAEEAEARVAEGYSAASMLENLLGERRAAKVRINGQERFIAAEDAGLYRDALGVSPPAGLPADFLAERDDPMVALLSRYARTHGPFPTAWARERYGVDPTPALKELEAGGSVVRGEIRPGGTEREWCDAEVLRRVRRASLAHLRQEVEPADGAAYARFLASWQGIDRHRPLRKDARPGAGTDRLREVLVPLQGVALTQSVWENDVLPRRLGSYSSTWLDELCTSGEVVWIGAGAVGRTDGRVALYFREDVRLAGPPPANAKLEKPEGEIHDAIRERLAAGPAFWLDLVGELDHPAEELHSALWDLAFGGEITNDSFAPLRAPRLRSVPTYEPGGRRFSRRRAATGPTVQGRWSLTETLFRNAPAAGPKLRAQAELMLERYGILTREMTLAEGIPGGFSTLYPELSNLEVLGTARRGYFVEGLGGAQFALSGAVERLRALPAEENGPEDFTVLAATDPASPWGSTLPWPKLESRRKASRSAGAYVLARAGHPLLYVERGGKGILRLEPGLEGGDLAAALASLAEEANAGRLGQLKIERFDGEPILGSSFEQLLVAAGFSRQPRRLVAPA
ncbi:MAG: DEAD/DEAH box helicase [Solirubrobacterales bacterium]|nr:DEAD/DEAH box helicase [Solirubrobacterales bacterium]OJU96184.1 MAG: DEAD/DEAH box helicase [Solirubrobacterales bacterium 67-14]